MESEAKTFYLHFLDATRAMQQSVWELTLQCERKEITIEQLKALSIAELDKVKEGI